MDLLQRPRRLRGSPLLREMVRRVELRRRDIIVPVFVCEGQGVQRPISSMPGVFQMSVDVAADWLAARAAARFKAYLAFGVIDRAKKNPTGAEALNADNVVCRLFRETKQRGIEMLAVSDLCFCEYTDHGHCGVINHPENGCFNPALPQGYLLNDPTLELLQKSSVAHAEAGADVIAPSGMIDGMVGAIRSALDQAGQEH
ncbi:MAG: porphobilinogen synthase, partial [Tepidisphaeraceae bacterium]